MANKKSNKKLKTEIMDILDMYADLYWSNDRNNDKIDGEIEFDGIDANNQSLEYYIMEDLLINNKTTHTGKGWEPEHKLYLTDGYLKNSRHPYAYPRYIKQLTRYNEIKQLSKFYMPFELSREQINEIINIKLTDDERIIIGNKYLR